MLRLRFLFAFLLALAVVAPTGGQQPPPYRILVTNDDGVRAPGIAAVAQILQAIGQVIVVAPAENQSGKGHSITITEPMFREDLTLPNGLQAIGLTATPVSTMKVALQHIVRPAPDLVVSGINRGYNLGFSAYLSGTAGAAREAAMAGIPAIAASLAGGTSDYMHAAEAVLGVARRVKQYGLPPYGFLNVNIPAGEPKGYRIATQAPSPGGTETFAEAKHPNGRTYYWNVFKEGGGGPPGSDLAAVAEGYVAVTAMRAGELDASLQEKVREWFK